MRDQVPLLFRPSAEMLGAQRKGWKDRFFSWHWLWVCRGRGSLILWYSLFSSILVGGVCSCLESVTISVTLPFPVIRSSFQGWTSHLFTHPSLGENPMVPTLLPTTGFLMWSHESLRASIPQVSQDSELEWEFLPTSSQEC